MDSCEGPRPPHNKGKPNQRKLPDDTESFGWIFGYVIGWDLKKHTVTELARLMGMVKEDESNLASARINLSQYVHNSQYPSKKWIQDHLKNMITINPERWYEKKEDFFEKVQTLNFSKGSSTTKKKKIILKFGSSFAYVLGYNNQKQNTRDIAKKFKCSPVRLSAYVNSRTNKRRKKNGDLIVDIYLPSQEWIQARWDEIKSISPVDYEGKALLFANSCNSLNFSVRGTRGPKINFTPIVESEFKKAAAEIFRDVLSRPQATEEKSDAMLSEEKMDPQTIFKTPLTRKNLPRILDGDETLAMTIFQAAAREVILAVGEKAMAAMPSIHHNDDEIFGQRDSQLDRLCRFFPALRKDFPLARYDMAA